MALEHGYGEDVDYGMQIRQAGYDVIYAPQIQLLHLKAPVGGFRKPHLFPWQEEEVQPKPSPQIMYHRKKNYTAKQLLGYKVTLFIKFYKDYSIKNPISYYTYFKKAWNKSLYWSQKLAPDGKV
jgi:GT2 family glycosyltransferase